MRKLSLTEAQVPALLTVLSWGTNLGLSGSKFQPLTTFLTRQEPASVLHNPALHFEPFSCCFWGFHLNISGTSRVALNMAIGTVSGSFAAQWLFLSTTPGPAPRWLLAAPDISTARPWEKLPWMGLGKVHRGPSPAASTLTSA